MFDLQILSHQPLIKFNHQLPVFNWFYPFACDEDLIEDRLAPYLSPKKTEVLRRAIYIHIPFCETICNFCPYRRDKFTSDPEVEQYLNALVAEIDLKRNFLGRCDVDAIFVGGGTPSLLSPRQIEVLGEAIARNFNLHRLREFTFEVEVKSISRDKLQAMRDIGVDRISFGAQTFSEEYRALLSLDATRSQIVDAAIMLNSMFSYTNVDLLYGMAGQDLDQLYGDITAALNLQTTTVDVYPINNLSAPRSMHHAIARAGLTFLPATTRVQFRIYLDQFFRERGYAPISGYGYAMADKTCHDTPSTVQHSPKFLYHDIFYGYHDDEIIGYGPSAGSHLPGFVLHNSAKTQAYVSEVLTNKTLPHRSYGPIAAPERGIISFPFRGTLEKSRIAWAKVPEETLLALQEALNAELIVDLGKRYELTKVGWLFYVNLMYYLMPSISKHCLSNKIEQLQQKGRRCGNTELSPIRESAV
jgi:coproporphyrinogen III oxidase-like Fe-S oxidoreductase